MATRGMTEFRADGVDYTVNDPNIAPEFNAASAYSKGDYVNYQGDLYRLTADHAANDTWANTSKTKIKMGAELATEKANRKTADDTETTARENGDASVLNQIAPVFDVDTAYTKGQYVTYNGTLYRLTEDHASGTGWSSTSKTTVKISAELNSKEAKMDAEVSDLQNEIINNVEKSTGNKFYNFIKGGFINTSGSTTNFQPTANASYEYAIIDCAEGDVFLITVKGGGSPRAFAVVKDNGDINTTYRAPADMNATDYEVTIPAGYTKLIINNDYANKVGIICKNEYFAGKVFSAIEKNVQEITAIIGLEKVWEGSLIISGSGSWTNYANNESMIVKIEPGRIYEIRNTSASYGINYGFLKSASPVSGQSADFASGASRQSLSAESTIDVMAPSDAKYLYFDITTNVGTTLYYRYPIIADVTGKSENPVALEYTSRFIGTWADQFNDDPSRSGYLFPVKPNTKYKIKIKSTVSDINFAFLTRKPTSEDTTAPIAFDTRRAYHMSEVTFIVPQGSTKYIWVIGRFQNTDLGTEVYDLGASAEITVAASDSGAFCEIADFVCDGTNDEAEIQAAVDGLTNGGLLTLYPGNYYVDDFPNTETLWGETTYSAIFFGYNGGIAREIRMRGVIENKSYNTRLGTTIHVTATAKANKHTGTKTSNCLICGCMRRPPVETGDISYNYTHVNNANFENMYLYCCEAFSDLTMLDCRYFGDNEVKEMTIATEDYFYNRFHNLRQTTPGVNSYGIRSCKGSNDESSVCYYAELNVGGFYIGYEFNGLDHLVCRRVDACRDVYGYWFKPNRKTQTMINCAYEGCTHGAYFESDPDYALGSHLTCIDFNIEPSSERQPYDPTGKESVKFEEQTPGYWRGFVSYTAQGYWPIWASGSGHNMETVCLEDSRTEPTAHPEYLARYFDTTNNVWKTWNGTAWV